MLEHSNSLYSFVHQQFGRIVGIAAQTVKSVKASLYHTLEVAVVVHKLVRNTMVVLPVEVSFVVFLFGGGCRGVFEVVVPER
jgi:hypothetical protein